MSSISPRLPASGKWLDSWLDTWLKTGFICGAEPCTIRCWRRSKTENCTTDGSDVPRPNVALPSNTPNDPVTLHHVTILKETSTQSLLHHPEKMLLE